MWVGTETYSATSEDADLAGRRRCWGRRVSERGGGKGVGGERGSIIVEAAGVSHLVISLESHHRSSRYWWEGLSMGCGGREEGRGVGGGGGGRGGGGGGGWGGGGAGGGGVVRTVVEASGVPHPVVASGAAMEVHAVSAIKHVDAIIGVLAGVAVHNVNEHNQTKPVSLVNQGLQLIRCSKPAASL